MNVLILGIGNILWADEGFGVRAVEELNRQYQFGDNVRLMDGGTQGLYLIQYVQNCDLLIVFDAVDYGLEPGTIKIVHDEEVPKFMAAKKMSLHQTGFQEVLSIAELTGKSPKHIFLIGVQPAQLEDFGGSLGDEVKAQIKPTIQECLKYLDSFSIEYQSRNAPLLEQDNINSPSVSMYDYEIGRPAESMACRQGDWRVLFNDTFVQRENRPIDFKCNTSVFVDGRKHFKGH